MTSIAQPRHVFVAASRRAAGALGRIVNRRFGVVERGPCDRTVCLTFDDGPHAEHTPRVLDVLAAHGVRATFFVVGRHVERHPTLVRQLLAEGHQIGHHTYAHDAVARASSRRLLRDVRRTDDLLFGVTGRRSRLFRPPHGRIAPWNVIALRNAGLEVVLWSIDARDCVHRSASMLRRSLAAQHVAGGDIVLFHDDGPVVPDVLPEFIERVRARGLRLATCADGSPAPGAPQA